MPLSWKYEGMKTIVFRADYRRPVDGVASEYRTAFIDVVFVKTDLPLQFVSFSPDTRDGDAHQRFIVQSLGELQSKLAYQRFSISALIDRSAEGSFQRTLASYNVREFLEFISNPELNQSRFLRMIVFILTLMLSRKNTISDRLPK